MLQLYFHIGYGTQYGEKKVKTETNKKRKLSFEEDLEDEEDSKDWWTKYFASVERMIEESKESKKVLIQNGTLQIFEDDHSGNNSDKSPGRSPGAEFKKKFGFKAAANASRFTTRISPKSVRKRNKNKPQLCKVRKSFKIFW